MSPRTIKRKLVQSEGETSKRFEYSAKTFRFLLGENTRLEREAAIFREEWMRKAFAFILFLMGRDRIVYTSVLLARPNEQTTVTWLTNTARLLNKSEAKDDDDDENENAGEKLADISDMLGLEHDELDNCRVSSSITTTARRVLALKYPAAARTTMTFADVPNNIKKAVRGE